MATELRQKKLASGKEKLAAFRSKKAKALKKLNANSNASFEIDEELRQQVLQDFNSTAKGSEETSPSDSELCSLTSDDEQFDEAAILCSSQTHVPFTLSELENAMDEKHMIKDIIQYGEPSQWTDLSRIESALSQRDELLSQLASSLEFFQKHPSQTDDFTTQLCALAQHICTLKAKLNQANEDLQEQLILHESSMISLQAAKAQILQLQMIIIKKDEHINSLSQKVQMENEALKLKDKTIEHCQLNLLAQSAELDTIRREMESKLVEIQQWAEANREWELKEQELLASVCDKSEEIFSLEKSLQVLKQENSELHEKYVSLQASSAENNSDARLHDLEQHLAGLRSAHELDLQEMSRLQKRNHDLEISCDDHLKSLSLYQSLQQDYDHIMAQHSSCLQQLENLNILNANLQHKIDLLGQAEQEHQVLRQHFEELKFSHDCEVRKRSELEAKLLDFENSLESKTNGRTPPFQTTSVLYHTATNSESEYQVKEVIEAGLHTAGNFERNVSSGERNGSFQQERIEIVPAEIDSPCQELDSEKLQLLAVNEDLRFKLNSSEALNRQYVERLGLLENVTYPDQNIYSPHMGVIGSNTEELEQLKEEIKKLTLKIQTQEIELNKTTTELTVSKESLMRIESELTLVNQFNSQESSTGANAVQEIEDIYRLQLVQQQLREKETAQEELQTQLESTITQWQKLQLIVQEKEIDIQNLHENLDEQKRICGNMTKSHQDYVEALQSEIETLRLRLEEYQEKFFNMENEILLLITEKNSIQSEERKGNELSHKEMLCTEIQTDLNSVDAETQTSCLDPESQDIPIEPELHTALRDAEFQTASLYAEMDENLNQQIKAEKLSEVSSIHLKDTYQSAQLTLSEDCVTVLELKQSIIQKDSLISSLQRTVADFRKMETRIHNFESELVTRHDNLKERLKLSEDNLAMKEAENVNMSKKLTAHQLKLKAFKKQISQKDKVIAELTDKITESQNQISDINPQVTEKNNEISELLNQVVQKDEIIADLQLRLSKRDQSFESRNEIKNEESEVQTGSNVERDVLSDLTETLFERNTEVTRLNRVVIEREELLSTLNKELCDINERYTDLLKNTSEKDNELDEKEDQLSTASKQLADKDEQLSVATRQLAEKDEQLSVASRQLAEKDDQLSAATTQLAEKDQQLSAATTQLAEKDQQLGAATTQLAEKEDQLSAATTQLAEKDEQLSADTTQLAEKEDQLSAATTQLAEKDEQLSADTTQLAEKEDQLSAATTQLAEKDEQLSAATRQLAEKDEQLSAATRQLAEKDEQLSAATRQLAAKEDQLSAATRQLAAKDEQLSAATRQLAEKEDRLSAATRQLAEKDQLSAATTQLAEKDEQLRAATRQLAEKEDQLSAATTQLAEKEDQLSAATTQLAEKEDQLCAATRQLAEKENQLSAATTQLAEKDEQLSAATRQLAEKDEQLSVATRQLAEKEDQLSAATTHLADKDEQLSAATTQLDEKDEQLSAATRQLDEKETFISTLNIRLLEMTEKDSYIVTRQNDASQEILHLQETITHKDEELAVFHQKLQGISDDITQLKSVVSERDRENFSLAEGLLARDSEVLRLTDHFKEKDDELSSIRKILTDKEEEIVQLHKQLSETKNQEASIALNLSSQNEEVNRLLGIINQRDEQLENLCKELSEKSDHVSELVRTGLERDETITSKEKEHSHLLAISDKKDAMIAALNKILAEKENELTELSDQISSHQSAAQSKAAELTYINEQLFEKDETVGNLLISVSGKNDLIIELNGKLTQMTEDFAQLQKAVSEGAENSAALTSSLCEKDNEISKLNITVTEQLEDISNLKEKLIDRDIQYQSVLSEKNELEITLNHNLSAKFKETNELHKDISEKDQQLIDLKKILTEQSAEILHLQEIISEKESVVDKQSSEKDALILSLQYQITDKEVEISHLQTTLVEKDTHFNDIISAKEADISTLSRKLTLQCSELNRALLQKDEEMGDLLITLSGQQETVSLLNCNLVSSSQEISSLHSVISERDIHIKDLSQRLSDQAQEMNNLKENISALIQKLTVKDGDISAQQEKVSEKEQQIVDLSGQLAKVEIDKLQLQKELVESQGEVCKTQAITGQIHDEIEVLRKLGAEKDVEIINLQTLLRERESELIHRSDLMAARDVETATLLGTVSEKEDALLSMMTILNEREHSIAQIQNVLSEKTLEMDSLQKILEDKNSELVASQIDIECRNEENAKLLLIVKVKEESISALQSQLNMVSDVKNETNLLLSAKENEIVRLTDQINDLVENNSKLSEKLSLMESVTVCQKDEQLNEMSKQLSEKGEELAAINHLITLKDKDIGSLNETVLNKSEEVRQLSAMLKLKIEEVVKLTAITQHHTENCHGQLVSVQQQLADKDSVIESITLQLSEVDRLWKDTAEKLTNRDSELETLNKAFLSKEADIDAAHLKLVDLDNTNRELNDTIVILNKKLADCMLKLNTKETDLSETLLRLSEKEEIISGIQSERDNIVEQIVQQDICINGLKDTVTSHESEISRQKQQYHDVVSMMKVEQAGLLAEVDNLTRALRKKDLDQVEMDSSQMKSQLLDFESEIERIKKEFEYSDSEKKVLEASNNDLLSVKESLLLRLDDMEHKMKEKDTEISEMSERLVQEKEHCKLLVNSNTKLQKSYTHLQSCLSYLMATSEESQSMLIQQKISLQEQEVNLSTHSSSQNVPHTSQDVPDGNRSHEDVGESHSKLVTEKSLNYQLLLNQLLVLTEDCQNKDGLLLEQNLEMDRNSSLIADLSAKLEETNLTLSEAVQSNTSLRAEADALKVQCHTLTDGESVLNQRISLLEAEVESQGLISSHHVTECNTLADNMAQLSQELNVKEKLLLASKLEAESHLKEVNDLKAGLELKAATERSLKESVDSLTSLLEKSQEERELLKANFDSCMEDMQQKHAQQELDIQNLRSQLAEQTKTVYQGQDQLKDLFELQICQLEEKLLLSEKHGEHLAKELADSKAKYSSCKDLFEGQMSDLEISLQAANSETAKLRDQLSKVTHNHECDFAGLKRLHEIQTSELEESCLSLERNVSELKRQITEQAAKFKKEKSGLEQSLDFHLSDFEEKRRLHETEISRLKRHLEEMKQDHEMELRNLEKSYEARMYELEDKCCITTNELERLRKFFSSDGEYSEERHRLDLRIDELETKRRDLEIQNMALEDEVKHLREQEEEFKSLLHSMAEKRDEKVTEKAEEVISLKHELSEMAHEKNQVDLSLQTKKADIERVMNRNKELESRIAYLEVLVEHTVTLGMKDKDEGERSSLSNMSDLQRQIDSLSEENRSLKRQLVLQAVPKRSLRLNSGVEAICPPYSHTSTEYTSSQTINNECFSPVLDDEVLEGFVAEKFNSNRQKSECNMNNNSRVNPEPDFVVEQNDSFQEPDFVVEQTDRFQPEIDNERLMDGGSQLDMHPIWENEGFQPEKSDLFLMETMEETEQRMDWPNELSVCLSPSQHQISERRFDFSNSGEHCHSSHVHETEEKNLGGEEVTVLVNNKTCEDGENTRQINQLKEDLEEQYVMKMRKQESDLMFKYESQCDQYKKEMEQHFAQKVQAVRYEWERKFTKALRKLKKDMEKRGLPEQAQDHRSRASDSTDSKCGRMNSVSAADIAGRHEELGEVVEKLHKENQELAEVRDDLLRQIEISRARGLHDRVQHELQTMLTTRDSHSLPCAPVQTILPPAVDYEESVTPANLSIDEGDGSKSEASDSRSVRECFLEELEEISHQSGQDLPLEWELTSTETGAFEQEPASIWEVFDGRCVRQDCQEVRIRFHKLYKWVVKHQGVGCDSLLYELNYLLGNTLDTEALKNESIDYSLNKTAHQSPSIAASTAHQSPSIAASDAASESIGSSVCNASGGLNQNSTNSSEVSIPIARKSIYEEIMELNMTELGQNSESHIYDHEIAVHEGCGPNVDSDSSKSSVHRDSELLVMSFSENSDKNVDDSPITLQDQKLADELNLLRKDLVDTKAIYCKENALLQKALLKNQEGKVKVKSQRTSDKNFELCGHQTGKLTPDSSGEHEITKQKLAICMEQIGMLEDENTSLRSRLRKQEAMTIHLKFQLHQKDQDVIEWQKSFSNHLTALQKQRSDLLQLLEDKESGKEPFISGGLQEVQISNTVQQVQDDLLGKIEELDHLYKMLTLRQIELQHCEAERRHLEQMCLLKDFTEIQLKKQKRLMEEHISEIELRLHDRELALREDKNRLLQELKEQDIKLSDTACVRVPADSQPSPNFTEEKSSNLSSPKQARNDENDTSRQHIKAIEVLRAKLLKEYEMQAAKLEKVKRENMKS